MAVRLKKNWFNPVYFHLRHYVDYPNIRRIMLYGGKSSAKTFSIGQLFAVLGYIGSCSSIAYRKEQTTIKTTLKPSFVKGFESICFQNAYREMDFKLSCVNDSEIVFKGLDTEGKIKGVEGFKYLLFDELDHFSEAEWKQANLSLRGIPGQKLFATWNPISEDLWIKEYLDKETWTDLPLMLDGMPESRLDDNSSVKISKDGKTLLIKTTYLDNKWVVGADGYGYRDENLIYEYERLKEFDPDWYDVNVLGNWGQIKTGMEFFHAFKKNVHVKECAFDKEYPVHLTYDFNVVPYMTQLCCQIINTENKMYFRFFKEYCLSNPDNSGKAVAMAFVRDFGKYKPLVFYYGDAAGKKRIEGQGNKRNFDDIEAELVNYLHADSDRVLRRNPNHFKARDFINLLLKGFWPDIELQVDPSCKELIKDLQKVKVSIEGMHKERFNDKELGVTYEKYGHTSQAMYYLIISVLNDLYRATSERG